MAEMEYSGIDNLEVMREAVNYNAYLVKLLLSLTKSGDKIVDFGAGSGTFAIEAKAAGHQVVCVETDPTLVNILKSHGFCVERNLEDVADNSVDYLYSLNVLEHIEHDQLIVALWFRKLRPGGKLLVYVPAFQSLYSSMDRKVGHFRRYDRTALKQVVADAGFKINTLRYVDSMGYLASLLYKVVGNDDGTINRSALLIYDRFVFPASIFVDTFTHKLMGKNVYAIATKPF